MGKTYSKKYIKKQNVEKCSHSNEADSWVTVVMVVDFDWMILIFIFLLLPHPRHLLNANV